MKPRAVIVFITSASVTLPGALVDWMATTFFPLDKWQFFFDAMENMKKERAKSSQVCIDHYLHQILLRVANLMIWYGKKFNDFIETATEAIGNYTREENGKQVPIWTKEQVDEIVTSQVFISLYLIVQIFLLKPNHSFIGHVVYGGWLFDNSQCIDVLLFHVGPTSR